MLASIDGYGDIRERAEKLAKHMASTALILRLAEYTALVLRLAMGNAFEAMVLLWENGTIVGNSIEG